MDLDVKLSILADAAKYDASCAASGSKRSGDGRQVTGGGAGVCHSYTPDGRCITLLKVLLTNHCIFDCKYCVNRVGNDTPRARFTAAEVVGLTLDFHRRNYIDGLFLSSGVIQNADYTMEQMAEVARSLREDHRFNGYIHLKAVPGVSDELLEKAGRYADRLSANIELPTQEDLDALAPGKTHAGIESSMATIAARVAESKTERAKSKAAPPFAPGGQSTQLIVGATPASDRLLLATATGLYQKHQLRRVYYSAFSPIPHGDVRLPGQAPPLLREHRLYQADWLMRFYGFEAGELTTLDQPALDLECDPKLAWALRHRAEFPVDVNRASRGQLLRVPGLGVRNVLRILAIRRYRSLRLEDLRVLRVSLRKVGPFVITADHNPAVKAIDRLDLRGRVAPLHSQLELFAASRSALVGEV